MITTQHTIVLRLVPGAEGQWWIAERAGHPQVVLPGRTKPITLVPTGNVEWDGDRCAEVYVPEHLLAVWRAEHDLYESIKP